MSLITDIRDELRVEYAEMGPKNLRSILGASILLALAGADAWYEMTNTNIFVPANKATVTLNTDPLPKIQDNHSATINGFKVQLLDKPGSKPGEMAEADQALAKALTMYKDTPIYTIQRPANTNYASIFVGAGVGGSALPIALAVSTIVPVLLRRRDLAAAR